jgi:glutaredoxin 3
MGAGGTTGPVDALTTALKLGPEGSFVPLVEIYTKSFCPYCWRAKALLESKGVKYEEIAVDYAGTDRQVMIERANGRSTVPQIFIAGTHVGGCDDLMELDRAGKLDALIAA